MSDDPDQGTPGVTRRDALSMLAAAAIGGSAVSAQGGAAAPPGPRHAAKNFRIRALTGGVSISDFADTRAIETTLDFLAAAKRSFETAGYVVETIRVALNPLLSTASSTVRASAIPKLQALDALTAGRGAVISIGPIFSAGDSSDDKAADSIAAWAADLVRATKTVSFSGAVASASRGVHRDAVMTAARVISTLAHAGGSGIANFRFAAAACIPAGTPFFPVAYHEGSPCLSVGLETPNLVRQAFTGMKDPTQASERLRILLDEELHPVQQLARALADQAKRRYLGIDTSPAPARDSSIGSALETLTGEPFGSASTLQACAAVTAAVKSVGVSTCGYSGLMLPILEDPVLADRVSEGRIRISDLLLYSTVCGTGLDVVPIPGDVTTADLARLIGDVATLAVRLKKPLSARLFAVPGKRAGDRVEFADPMLCPSKVMPLDG
ncbi:MAG TPA: DUF711 family protein [Steroidobacteraceae bacterium]|nr:DUF711 family protein [Steroidobacteraceae bacterium]